MSRPRSCLLLALTVAVLVLCWAPPAGALTPAGGAFFWQSPQPFGWQLQQVTFADATRVWGAPDSSGRLARSDDGGLTWTAVDIGIKGHVWSLQFPDVLHGRAVFTLEATGQQSLLSTDDAGASWGTRAFPAGFFADSISFVDADHGWCLGLGKDADGHRVMMVQNTSDAGQTWTQTILPGVGGYPAGITVLDADHIWVARQSRGIVVSQDGGATWTAHSLPPRAYLEQLVPVGPDSAWALAQGGPWPRETLLFTSDGAATWKKVLALPSGSSARMAAATTSDVLLSCDGWLTPFMGTAWVQRTTDGGATWTRTYLGPESPGRLVVGPDGQVVLGEGAGLWRSADAGVSWTQLWKGDDGRHLEDVAATPTNGVWAIGAMDLRPADYDSGGNGLLLHAADGVTWREEPLPLGAPLFGVSFSSDLDGWAVGGLDRVLHTSDGGGTWQSIDAGLTLDMWDVAASGASTAVVTGWDWKSDEDQSKVGWTTDGGVTWTAFAPPSGQDLRDVCILGDGHWLVSGSRYARTGYKTFLLETTDAGVTWTRRVVAAGCVPRDMVFVDENHGWILAAKPEGFIGVPQESLVLRTSDGGSTWQEIDLGTETDLTGIAFADPLHGWAVGSHVLSTADGGATWQAAGGDIGFVGWRYPAPRLNAVTVNGSGQVWAIGGLDTIVSTVDTTADTRSPVTTDDGDRLWHRDDVTLGLQGWDAGGAVVTAYRVDGAKDWTQGDELFFGAPADHVGDGKHWVTYRSTDAAGNIEPPRRCPVMVDTGPPETSVGCARHAAVGSSATVTVRFLDELSPYGRVTLMLGRWQGGEFRPLKTIKVGLVQRNARNTVKVRYNVPAGAYWWLAPATDLAGNEGYSGSHFVRVR